MIKISFSNKKQTDYLKLFCDPIELQVLREVLSTPNPAYSLSKSKFTQSRLYAITPSGKIETGLLQLLIKVITDNLMTYEIDDNVKEFFKKNLIKEELINVPNKTYQYRDYQKDAIISALENKKGIVIIGTGGGKTLLTAGLILNFRKFYNIPNAKILITVPTLQLIEQTYSDLKEYGLENITKWSGNNELDRNCSIIVAGTSFLNSKKTDLSILHKIDLFIGDECHVFSNNAKINNIFKFLKTPYRFGLTGFLPKDEKLNYWNILGKFGSIIYEKKTNELKKDQHVSEFEICLLEIDHGRKVFSFTNNDPKSKYQNELTFLMNDTRRNEFIYKLVTKFNRNSIIMVNRISHGENIVKIFEKYGKKIEFIRGATPIEDRERIRASMEYNDDIIFVAMSKIFSTGINIRNLHGIFFASAEKAKIRTIQTIGRAIRKFPTKVKAWIFDICDNTYYGKIHKESRKNLYNQEKYKYTEKFI